jgi:uncharacterized protein involved in type VI secretion and phage assembly
MKPEFVLPIAQPQTATVVSNTDPEGQGRVQVRFDWQTNDKTHFIRMMSPDAGGTDQITQNRGYVAIPEVGDQVMVNFVHNHPDRPFVMGGMFHGGVGLGGGINNHMRSIQTKSGIKVLMNDDEGSVNIIDPSGNTYFMDGAGNITVTAPKNMTFSAGENVLINAGSNIVASAQKNVNILAGEDITETANDDYNLTASNITETAQVGRSSIAKNITENMEVGSYISTKDAINIESAKEVNINSGKQVKMQ